MESAFIVGVFLVCGVRSSLAQQGATLIVIRCNKISGVSAADQIAGDSGSGLLTSHVWFKSRPPPQRDDRPVSFFLNNSIIPPEYQPSPTGFALLLSCSRPILVLVLVPRVWRLS